VGSACGTGSTMPDGPAVVPRYSAFISYSSVDAKFAAWLHRELESLPPAQAALPAGGARLKPLFHDTWELNAHHDLPQALREAIADSESLIVVCSPAARGPSGWAARSSLVPEPCTARRPIRAALLEGRARGGLPAALCERPGASSPVAADFRRPRQRPQAGGAEAGGRARRRAAGRTGAARRPAADAPGVGRPRRRRWRPPW
jgi:hypothetical protein